MPSSFGFLAAYRKPIDGLSEAYREAYREAHRVAYREAYREAHWMKALNPRGGLLEADCIARQNSTSSVIRVSHNFDLELSVILHVFCCRISRREFYMTKMNGTSIGSSISNSKIPGLAQLVRKTWHYHLFRITAS
jgi:hypothetical protein